MSKSDLVGDGVRQDVVSDDSVYFSRAQQSDAAVERISREVWGPAHHIRRQTRDNCVLLYIIDGAGIYVGEAGATRVSSGWIVTLAPTHPHALRCDPRAPLEVNRVACVGQKMVGLLEAHLGRTCHAWSLDHPHAVAALLATMHQTAKAGGAYAPRICIHYLHILLLTIHEDLARRERHPSRAMSRFLRARAFMLQQFDTGIRVAEVAAACGVSPEHLTRLCQRFEGESPSRMLLRLRMSKASHLLEGTALTVGAVADQVGFGDLFTFSKAFKRWFGFSPRQYRCRG